MAKKTQPSRKEIFVSILLRYGLGIVFVYAGIAAFFNPENWIGFVPDFLDGVFLMIFSTYEILLGLGLFANFKTYHLSILSSLTLLAIIISNISLLDLLFRDVAIFFMSLSLLVLSHRNHLFKN